MSEGKQLIVAVIAGLTLITAMVAIMTIAGAARAREELETRRECFASNERIAKTLEKATDMPIHFNACDWR